MSNSTEDPNEEPKLPPVWQKVQSTVWLIGLAILFWQDWIFPGILVLLAISGLVQALLVAYVKRQETTQAVEVARELNLPPNCPNCGGPINKQSVRWAGTHTASCPFCGAALKLSDLPTTTPRGAAP